MPQKEEGKKKVTINFAYKGISLRKSTKRRRCGSRGGKRRSIRFQNTTKIKAVGHKKIGNSNERCGGSADDIVQHRQQVGWRRGYESIKRLWEIPIILGSFLLFSSDIYFRFASVNFFIECLNILHGFFSLRVLCMHSVHIFIPNLFYSNNKWIQFHRLQDVQRGRQMQL